ncbi:hypothetical protein PENSPDRAFT_634260 [Peniophora sp. CONT]|nr:hypothetical protein PENSPDRAFT_634260 [Peniophora sp. CONT]
MGASDPTYPLYPVTSVLAAALLLLFLSTSFVRQNWNLGVTLLCCWLFLDNLTGAVNTVIWSDNTDIKYYVYCDVVTRVQVITYVVKPMATLIITRRLYLIASLQSIDPPSKAAIPCIESGPDYIHQRIRFEVDAVFGCTYTMETSVLKVLTVDSWSVIPPIVSVCSYYPKVARLFYRQSRDINSFLNSNTSVSRTNYLRILILASIDVLLTLPIGITAIALRVFSKLAQGPLPFHWSWTFIHTDWEPQSMSYARIKSFGTANLAQFYFLQWTSPVLAFAIFGLFGLTPEARASYWRTIYVVGRWVGWKPTPRKCNEVMSLGEIDFGTRPLDVSLGDIEMGLRRVFSH